MPQKHTATGNPAEDALLSAYHYRPTEYVCILFVTLFALSTIAHLGQALRSRRWFLIATLVLGGVGEIVGWSARLWSSINILNPTPFTMQISSTIIAPTFMSAANFIILGTVINRVGPVYSRLTPRNYGIIFVSADVVALVVQAVGGGIASSANTRSGAAVGGNIMLGGIVLQLVAMVIYVILAGDFLYHVLVKKPVRSTGAPPLDDEERSGSTEKSALTGLTGRVKLMILGLGISTLFLFIRSIYRTIELSNGWNGCIIGTQRYFNILDGGMVTLAMFTINILHPNFLLYSE